MMFVNSHLMLALVVINYQDGITIARLGIAKLLTTLVVMATKTTLKAENLVLTHVNEKRRKVKIENLKFKNKKFNIFNVSI